MRNSFLFCRYWRNDCSTDRRGRASGDRALRGGHVRQLQLSAASSNRLGQCSIGTGMPVDTSLGSMTVRARLFRRADLLVSRTIACQVLSVLFLRNAVSHKYVLSYSYLLTCFNLRHRKTWRPLVQCWRGRVGLGTALSVIKSFGTVLEATLFVISRILIVFQTLRMAWIRWIEAMSSFYCLDAKTSSAQCRSAIVCINFSLIRTHSTTGSSPSSGRAILMQVKRS